MDHIDSDQFVTTVQTEGWGPHASRSVRVTHTPTGEWSEASGTNLAEARVVAFEALQTRLADA